MGARLRVGIVGADAKGQGWAPIAHSPALPALPEFEIAALCTAHEETARAAVEPDFEHALRRHRLIDTLARHAGS